MIMMYDKASEKEKMAAECIGCCSDSPVSGGAPCPHLVDHQQVLVLVYNIQRDIFRYRFDGGRRRHATLHDIARLDLCAGLCRGLLVDAYEIGFYTVEDFGPGDGGDD
jgi:hypothetical protein